MTERYKLQSYNNFENELALYRFYVNTNLKTRFLAWELCAKHLEITSPSERIFFKYATQDMEKKPDIADIPDKLLSAVMRRLKKMSQSCF